MKKRILFALLAVLMLFALAACENTTQNQDPTVPEPTLPVFEVVEPTQKDGVYQLSEPGHLLYMAENPSKKYALSDDIDMCGTTWKPIDDFTGSLTGQIYSFFNYTISNVVIEVAEGDANVGFFRTISGTVEEINFHNVTVTGTSAFTGNLGIVAGQSKTALTDVEVKDSTINVASVKDANIGLICGKLNKDANDFTATGAINVKLVGGTSYIGGGIGYAEGNVFTADIRTDLTLEGTGTAGAAGGITGYMAKIARDVNYGGHIKVTAEATYAVGAMVGELAGGGITNSYNCARSVEVTGGAVKANEHCGIQDASAIVGGCLIRDVSNIEEKTLSEAEYAMRKEVVDYAYQMATFRWYPSKDMFYSDDCGSQHNQTFKAGQPYFGMPYVHPCRSFDEFLFYLDENRTVLDSVPATKEGIEMFGNDCSDFVYWAWAQVEADIAFTLCKNCTVNNGVLPVGGYTMYMTGATLDSSIICDRNGAQAIYEAYAQAKMGDAVVHAPGHIRLVAENAYIFRNEDGTIDPNKSYLITHEQGFGGNVKNHSFCKTNHKYTFADLFRDDYIPVTMAQYAQGTRDELVATTTNEDLTIKGVGSGVIHCNYRPDKITMRVLDSNGNAVLELVDFASGLNIDNRYFALSEFREEVKAMKLESGKEYTYEVFVTAGAQEVCVQTYKFTA